MKCPTSGQNEVKRLFKGVSDAVMSENCLSCDYSCQWMNFSLHAHQKEFTIVILSERLYEVGFLYYDVFLLFLSFLLFRSVAVQVCVFSLQKQNKRLNARCLFFVIW